jgi:hypothetical protein
VNFTPSPALDHWDLPTPSNTGRAWDTQSQSANEDDDESIDAALHAEPYSQGRRSLLETLSNVCPSRSGLDICPSLLNLTTWKNLALSTHNDRSCSPPCHSVIAGSIPPTEHPVKIFRDAFKELAGKLMFLEDLFLLARSREWNAQFIGISYLHVPDWRSQVRMHYFANCVDNIHHIQSVLTIAVEHKLNFQIGVHTCNFHFFNTDVISKIDQRLLKEMYKPGFVEASLTYSSPLTFLNSYLGKVADVLQCPHARAFIGLGGPHSWLAQCWGGDDLVGKFMSGPSLQVTHHFKGQSDSTEDHSLGIHWDEVSAQEIEFLFGYIPADRSNPKRWLYPPSLFWTKPVTTGVENGT